MDYKVDVALITATNVEINSVLDTYSNWQEKRFEGDSQTYYTESFTSKGQTRSIIAAKGNEMGMTACATLCMKIIEHFHPKYLIMVGIAAGVALEEQEQQIYGDVIAPDIIWNYSAGKFVSPEKSNIKFGTVGFVPRPTSIETDEEILDCIKKAMASEKKQCHVYIGPMASGSAVIANKEILEKQIRSQFQKTAGLDMESYAVAYVAANTSEPRPKAVVLKSVCDFADSRKSDQYQKFAAFTSMEFAKLLYENYLNY